MTSSTVVKFLAVILKLPASCAANTNKGADAVPCFDQVRRLQLGKCLTHHGTAHVKAGHDVGFRRQLFTWFSVPLTNAGGQRVDDFSDQAARPSHAHQLLREWAKGFPFEHQKWLTSEIAALKFLVIRQLTIWVLG